MALNPAPLKVFREPYPASGQAFAARIAKDYDTYAQNAEAGGSKPVFTGAERGKFEALLVPVFATWNTDPSRFAKALADAVVAYWTGLQFTGPGIGPVTAITPHAVIVPAVLSLKNGVTMEVANKVIAAALDAGTKTGIVTLTYPGSPPVVVPVPIT